MTGSASLTYVYFMPLFQKSSHKLAPFKKKYIEYKQRNLDLSKAEKNLRVILKDIFRGARGSDRSGWQFFRGDIILHDQSFVKKKL